jgi:hypothetical protein
LEKKKRPTEMAEAELEQIKQAARMIKGVENITVIDSFVVDKNDFLKAYKISRESGALYHDPAISGTVYQTEMGNKVLYGNQSTDGKMQLYSRIRLLDGWSEPEPLTSLNEQGNVNYPFLMSDGITLYYASDGEGSLGGYDIFVTRYDSENSNYLRPDNIGMPFNSPANDYMYAIDEFNNIGWFASDRYQPDNKVCIYVFVPNSSKEVYNYESTDEQIIINAASLRSIHTTWKDEEKVRTGKQRLAAIMYAKESGEQQKDFTLIIDDSAVYHTLGPIAGFITLIASVLSCIAIIVWFMHSKTMDKLSLKKTLDYKIDPLKGTHIRIGDKGIAITRLALIGNANFNGHIIEVRSADGLIDENTPIYVERMVEGTVIVRKFNQ